MNTNASEKSRQYTISEVERHGRIMLGTKIPVGRDPETGRVRQFSYVKHTKEEIVNAIHNDSHSPLHGIIQNNLSTDITIGELADRFWQSKQPFWSSNSRYSLNYQLELIKKYLGELPVIELSAMRAELFQSELMLAEGGPSYNSINSIMWLLSSLMEFAKGEQIPAFNAVKYVNRLLITEKRHALPDMEQLNAFLGLMENLGIYYILTILLICLGVRFGECISISEDDIFYEKQLIRINKHIIYHREIDSPNFTELQQNRKMNDSYYVTLPENCLPYIKRALSLQEEWRSRLGSEYRNDMHFIIADENGDKIQHSRYYSRFKHRARKCGLPELTIHDIRRAVAVNIYKQTGDIMAVQSALGHAQPFSSAIYLMKLTQPDSPISYTADEAYRHLKEDTP